MPNIQCAVSTLNKRILRKKYLIIKRLAMTNGWDILPVAVRSYRR